MTTNSKNDPGKALVVLSGGQDSTTCLFWAIKQWSVENVHAITFDYSQRHKVEVDAAIKIAGLAGVADRHEIVRLGDVLISTSPLVPGGGPLEQYKDHGSLPGGLEKTFVPMRNTLFLTLAANRAYHHRAFNIVTGVCEEDFGGYPDCRLRFIEDIQIAFNESINESDIEITNLYQGPFKIHTPLMHLSKAATVHMAWSLGKECWNALSYSHTSYDGQYPPLGHDHATLLRAKGFEEAGLPDPLILRAHREGLMELPKSPNYDNMEKIYG